MFINESGNTPNIFVSSGRKIAQGPKIKTPDEKKVEAIAEEARQVLKKTIAVAEELLGKIKKGSPLYEEAAKKLEKLKEFESFIDEQIAVNEGPENALLQRAVFYREINGLFEDIKCSTLKSFGALNCIKEEYKINLAQTPPPANIEQLKREIAKAALAYINASDGAVGKAPVLTEGVIVLNINNVKELEALQILFDGFSQNYRGPQRNKLWSLAFLQDLSRAFVHKTKDELMDLGRNYAHYKAFQERVYSRIEAENIKDTVHLIGLPDDTSNWGYRNIRGTLENKFFEFPEQFSSAAQAEKFAENLAANVIKSNKKDLFNAYLVKDMFGAAITLANTPPGKTGPAVGKSDPLPASGLESVPSDEDLQTLAASLSVWDKNISQKIFAWFGEDAPTDFIKKLTSDFKDEKVFQSFDLIFENFKKLADKNTDKIENNDPVSRKKLVLRMLAKLALKHANIKSVDQVDIAIRYYHYLVFQNSIRALAAKYKNDIDYLIGFSKISGFGRLEKHFLEFKGSLETEQKAVEFADRFYAAFCQDPASTEKLDELLNKNDFAAINSSAPASPTSRSE